LSLDERIERQREICETSTDPADWALLHALEAIQRAESDQALLHALTETGPTYDLPPWSRVCAHGDSEGGPFSPDR
jgi:hypothetical protein